MQNSNVSIDESIYQRIVNGEPFILDRYGHFYPLAEWPTFKDGNVPFHLLPGSFNPLHQGHTVIYRGMPFYEQYSFGVSMMEGGRFGTGARAYELSISRFNKPTLNRTELEQRLGQFKNACVLITNAPTFVEKIAAISNASRKPKTIVYHIGSDVAVKLYEMIDKTMLSALGASFIVYPRKQNGIIQTPPKHPKFEVYDSWVDQGFSSTAIRAGSTLGVLT
ncbi:MAG: hypothetical protein E6R04_11270 [Spirochaetes bacterium]|nr:MAG: hypothetical protein E6R04_11270 [Spirochaetota bacterium]